jgi:CHAT domain-containing protein
VSQSDNHLSPEQIEWWIESQISDPGGSVTEDLSNARQHLALCEPCRRRVSMCEEASRDLEALKSSEPSPATPQCPDDSLIRELAAGVFSTDEAETVLRHVIACDHCGPVFREAIADFGTDFTEDENRALSRLKISQPSYQATLARMLARQGKTEKEFAWHLFNRQRFPRRAVLVGLAAAVVILGLSIFWIRPTRRADTPETLLAQAYADQRTLELRVEGAPYAPLRQERGAGGSVLKKPATLLKAEYQIKQQLALEPENPIVLAEKGRAELLEWQYDEAIKSLKHALDLDPTSASVLCDLATAYAQRGDVENRPIDYGQAIEYLGQTLQKAPQNEVALFNRAILEERLQLREQAQKHWGEYLRLYPHGGWSQEAQQHLDALERKRKEGSARPSPETDPSRALPKLQSRMNAGGENPSSWPDSLDEEYSDIALDAWLPSFFNKAAADAGIVHQTQEWQALTLLASILVAKHQDYWLSDVLSVPISSAVFEGWAKLASAIRYNSQGKFDDAARAADQAQTLLQERCQAAYFRALWERAYALQRAQQGKLCLRAVDQASEALESQRYPWVAAQLHLEHAICSAMIGQMGQTQSEVQTALSLANSADYSTLALRVYHIMGIQAASQDPDRAWAWFLKGLDRHWAGSYRPFRIYQFYAEMSLTAETRAQWHLARTLMEEAVCHIARTPNRLMEAVARNSLAVDTQLAGDDAEALAEFGSAAGLFSSLPPTPAVNALLFSAQVYQASLLSQQGKDDAALQILHAARDHFSEQSQYWGWLHYYQAVGEVLLHRGNIDEAEHALHAAVHISESALETIDNETDRSLWERQTSRAYRSLVELEFENKHDPRNALELWEWYISAPIRGSLPPQSIPGIVFEQLDSDPPLPQLERVASSLPDLQEVSIISFAELKDGPVVWIFDDRGIDVARLSVSSEELDRAARRFVRLCSDPSSDMEEVRQAGRQLYEWMLAPIESRLDTARVLALETDGSLQEVPFAALVTRQGSFLGEHYTLVSSPGLWYWPLMRRDTGFSSNDSVLAVGTSFGASESNVKFPSLPDSTAEAENVSFVFRHSQLLLGNQATIAAVKRDLPAARVFHFAGHAITSSTRSGLLFGALRTTTNEEGNSPGFLDALQLARFPLKKVDLVVLSACTTGGPDAGPASPHGLIRAFQRAGVPHVIASEWDVDSHSTRALMEEFYKQLVTGRRPAEALKLASKAVRQRPETAHPYYWAAFTAFGLS